MRNVYRAITLQFWPWNKGIKFSKGDAGNGFWIKAEQEGDPVELFSMFFNDASKADIDAAVEALNKLLPKEE